MSLKKAQQQKPIVYFIAHIIRQQYVWHVYGIMYYPGFCSCMFLGNCWINIKWLIYPSNHLTDMCMFFYGRVIWYLRIIELNVYLYGEGFTLWLYLIFGNKNADTKGKQLNVELFHTTIYLYVLVDTIQCFHWMNLNVHIWIAIL